MDSVSPGQNKPAENASASLVYGTSYTAQINARQNDGSYRVTVDNPKVDLDGVLLALPVLGGHLGMQVRCNLTELTKVKLVYGSPSFIYATLPDIIADPNDLNRSLVWGPPMDVNQDVSGNVYSSHAEDLLEGEVEFHNLYGVSLQLLTSLMRMTAGDRAAVECHLINDMVRVVSGQWRHISGLGEDLIFDHGRPTMERGWSMYRHEVLGALAEKEPYAEMNGDEVDRELLEQKRITAVGRHRFREFIGFAGDFIHSFVSDPPATMASLAEGAAASGAGKSWLHRNSDGSVIVQSVADIRFERVCRIPVPVRYAHHEDPSVTTAREYDKLDAEYLKLPQAISPVDPKDVYQMAYHIRSYSRWLSRYHSFARMLQLSGEYEIPSEANSPVPDWTNAEADRKSSNSRVLYYDAYACVSILRDGSIVTQDGYGSTVMMSNGNVQISAARHLDFEAAGDIRMVSGGSILVKARRNIELSATLGGLILHSYAWLKMLCESGTVWLRSNAAANKDVTPTPKETGAPTPEVAGWVEGEKDGFGVLVEAVDGAAAYRSQKGMTIAVDGIPADDEDKTANITLTTAGDLILRGDRKAALQSGADISLSSQRVAIASQKLLSSSNEVTIGAVAAAPHLVLRNGELWCPNLSATRFSSNSIRGPERGAGSERHFNHIDKLPTPVTPPAGADADSQELLSEAKIDVARGADLPWESPVSGPAWAFPPKSEYVWDGREKSKSAIPETLTQQYLRLDADAEESDRWDGNGYKDWNLRSVLRGKRTGTRGGFGYYELQYQADDSGESLREPSDIEPSDMQNLVTSWRPRPRFAIKALKRELE
jgi:hypothetical protein